MRYTKNQHVLSQWVLRNFRSDNTATASRDQQRVWCHTVYKSPDKENDIKEIPLKIASVAIRKNCFMLIDQKSGKKFDIEDEISEYEKRTSILFHDFIHNNSFEKLLDVQRKNNPLECVLNFMVIQMVLNLRNPQNKMKEKEEFFDSLIERIENNLEKIIESINNPPAEISNFFKLPLYEKLIRVANSNSTEYEKSKTLFVLFMIIESQTMPSLIHFLSKVRNELFKGLYVTGIYHSGYDFDSTELRPVFTIGPNVFSFFEKFNQIYLPLSHNLAISFSIGNEYYNSSLEIFSPYPEKLKCKSSKVIKLFRVSHDFIDNITSWVNMGNIGCSNTIYTPYELKNVEAYISLQKEDKLFFYDPSEPEFVVI
jgi:hypothetical protein